MKFENEIGVWVEAHRAEMLEDIKTLCRIDSAKTAPEEGCPFGAGPYRALKAAEQMAAGYGFVVTNYDNYVCTADLNGGERQLDILAHLDVVPAQEGWTVTEAFDPLEKDGKLYGRGTADDKGPAVAALYAMRCVKELGLPVAKNARLILGTDEECGSSCIAHYYQTEKEAPMSFSPDAEYPVINGEKGRLPGIFTASWKKKEEGARVVRVTGGRIENAVPPRASAVVVGISRMVADVTADAVRKKLGAEIEIENGTAKEILGPDAPDSEEIFMRITAVGRNAHAAEPETGLNALTVLLRYLAVLPLEESASEEAIRNLAGLMPHGDTDGRALGIAVRDPENGKLTLAFSQLEVNETGLRGLFDCRYPSCIASEELVKRCSAVFSRYGMKFDGSRITEPHFVPGDSVLVKELNRVYEEYTGLEGGCRTIGGGTYVHGLQRGVAFGAALPGTDNRMHAPDEFAVIEELVVSAKMFAQIIADLCA